MADDGRRRQAVDLLLLFLLTLPACYPLTAPGVVATHDALQHIFRFYDFDYALRGGEWFPRWSPNLLFGYGSVLLNYYASLTYYLSLPFLALSRHFLLSIELLCALAFLAGALAMYLLCRPLIGRLGAFVSALVYTYLPYHLADAYVRGTLGETLAFALLPAILWLLRRALQNPHMGNWAAFALSLTALLLTHNLSILLAAPAVVIFAGIWLWRRRQPRLLLPLLLSAVGSVALGAFFWLPILAEAGAIRASQVVQDASLVVRRLGTLSDMLSPYWVYRYYPYQGTAFEHPLNRVAVLGLDIAAVVILLCRRHLSTEGRHWTLASGAVLALGLFMMTRPAAWFYPHIPGLLYLQFPGRWQLIVRLGTAGLIGAAVHALGKAGGSQPFWKTAAGAFGLLIGAGLMLTSLMALPHDPLPYPFTSRPFQESDIHLEGMAAYEQQLFLAAREWRDPWILESVPAWVQVPADELILPAVPSSGHNEEPALAGLTVERHAPAELRLQVTALRPTVLRLHSFYFPGWRAWVDGRPAAVYPSTPMGLLTVDVPAGEHVVRFRFDGTLPRRLGTLISLGALLAGLGLLLRH
ncbi:MAG: 6-pyruvoyl-tetrahydropterin synthase-related protein, partial [Anaerolineae bacterium]